MKVYRWENEFGLGPYQVYPLPFNPGANVHVRQPGPIRDGLLEVDFDGYEHIFGFSSMKQAKQWFIPREEKELALGGYTLNEYEVPENYVFLGGHQVAFERAKAEKIRQVLPRKDAKA